MKEGMKWDTPLAKRLGGNPLLKPALHTSYSFVLGWVNFIMYMRYHGFATMMVGNALLLGISLGCHLDPHTCPMQLPNAELYAFEIMLFMLGSFLYTCAEKITGFSSRPFAVMVPMTLALRETLEAYHWIVEDDIRDLWVMSPLFGMVGVVALKGGLGTIPWGTTGDFIKIGYHLASYSLDCSAADLKQGAQSAVLIIAFIAGCVLGSLYHGLVSEVICMTFLAVLVFISGAVFGPESPPHLQCLHETSLLCGSDAEGASDSNDVA